MLSTVTVALSSPVPPSHAPPALAPTAWSPAEVLRDFDPDEVERLRKIVGPIVKRRIAPFREMYERRLAESQKKIDYMKALVQQQRTRREMNERFNRLRARVSLLGETVARQERTIEKLEAELAEIEYEMESSASRAARTAANGRHRRRDDDPLRRLEVLPDGTVRCAPSQSTGPDRCVEMSHPERPRQRPAPTRWGARDAGGGGPPLPERADWADCGAYREPARAGSSSKQPDGRPQTQAW